LTKTDKEKIALSIFQEVSIEFEKLQRFGILIGNGKSSFDIPDLVSNLLGFYNVVRPNLTRKKIMKLAGQLTIQQSLEIYKKYPNTFKEYKNKKFTPVFFQNIFCKNPKFPIEFQQIKPFSDSINLFWNINKKTTKYRYQ